MRYDLSSLAFEKLLEPVSSATASLVRLDERLGRSNLRQGCVARADFADACASLWLDGELVHLEDLVLHDAGMSIRAPTHELTIAHEVLRTRRRIMDELPAWALSAAGLRELRGGRGQGGKPSDMGSGRPDGASRCGEGLGLETKSVGRVTDAESALADELAAIEAVLARSNALLADTRQLMPARHDVSAIVYEPDWNENERMDAWLSVVVETEGLPPTLRAALVVDAWGRLKVMQHASWLGRLLAASLLRQAGATGSHLAFINIGLKAIPRERRTSRDRDTRLIAILEAIRSAADSGLRDHDRLLLARQQMQRKLDGRRASSKLPQLIDLVLSRPMVSSGMIAEALDVTPQGALKIAAELNLRELTGRGRFRAWGII